jgi:hypothetical protein
MRLGPHTVADLFLIRAALNPRAAMGRGIETLLQYLASAYSHERGSEPGSRSREHNMRGFDVLRGSIRALIVASLALIPFTPTAPAAPANDAGTPAAGATQNPAQQATPRPAQSSYKSYFFEFRARSAASYGHMYVLYGQVNGRGEIVKSDIAGLHPAGDANDCENCSLLAWTLGHILFVPSEIGASDGDLEEKYVTARYRVMVDAATYKKVSAYISKLKADKPMWNAFVSSCVTFGNGIAENIGLKTPASVFMEPKDYVESLRDLNGGKPQKALRFAAPSAASAEPAKPATSAAPARPSQTVGTVSGATR